MVAWSVSTFGLPARIIIELQEIATLHKTGKKYNKGLYTHGGSITCKSLHSVPIHFTFIFSITIFMLWWHIRNVKPQNGMV
jgi:hypothetical protein